MKSYRQLYMRLARVHGQLMMLDAFNGFPLSAAGHKDMRRHYLKLALCYSDLPPLTDSDAPELNHRPGVHGYEETVK